jgi:hypothetical protein
VSALIVAEPFFSIVPAVTPIVQGNVVADPIADCPVSMAIMPIVGSPMAEIDEKEEPIANHEKQQQPPI